MRFSLLALIFVTTPTWASSLGAYFKNEEGVAKFQSKSVYPAYQLFLQGLEEDPMNPELQLNIALTFEVNEEFDKAEAAYKGALKVIPPDSPRRFEALFNLAGVQVKLKHLEDALETYQAALEMQPESKEVKTNIELMWKNGGGGGGDSKEKDKPDKDGKGQQQQPKDGDRKDQPEQKEQKKQPKPFQSKELDQQDVKKILDEIKNQEQSIRAQEYERNLKEAPRGKDW